jgi:Etoposide-induced protein 2.4 (EI24)
MSDEHTLPAGPTPRALLWEAFWRAVTYCLHPKVVLWSVLPLVASALVVFGLGWLYWETSIDALRRLLEDWEGIRVAKEWLRGMGAGAFLQVLEPLIVVAVAVPLVVVLTLFCVSVLMTPALVRLVATRRFPTLERRRGASWLAQGFWSIGHVLVAVLLLIVTLPLWLIPPLILFLPPLIWGWLTYRVMAFDVMAEHASTQERRDLLREQRWPLLGMGIVAGYLGAAPSLLWAAGAVTLIFAPVLMVVSVWLYTLVFAFSALWFAHFGLSVLQISRRQSAVQAAHVSQAALATGPLVGRL